MGLDIRLPLGLIFAITGTIMLVYGTATLGSYIYAISMGINLNVIWGGIMTIFGIWMFILGRKRN